MIHLLILRMKLLPSISSRYQILVGKASVIPLCPLLISICYYKGITSKFGNSEPSCLFLVVLGIELRVSDLLGNYF
jgi:hypothetical protein